MKESLRTVISLLVVCVAAAASLALVYQVTTPKIEEQVALALAESLKKVFPDAHSFEPLVPDTVWAAHDEADSGLGIVFLVSPRGYASRINTLVGLGIDGKITGIRTATPVEGLRETPGLGLKVNEAWFQKQFLGKAGPELILKADDPGKGTIDAITAATISSRAVTIGVRKGVERYSERLANLERSLPKEVEKQTERLSE